MLLSPSKVAQYRGKWWGGADDTPVLILVVCDGQYRQTQFV
jgi:hypothetical protein